MRLLVHAINKRKKSPIVSLVIFYIHFSVGVGRNSVLAYMPALQNTLTRLSFDAASFYCVAEHRHSESNYCSLVWQAYQIRSRANYSGFPKETPEV